VGQTTQNMLPIVAIIHGKHGSATMPGVSRKTLSEIVNERGAITPDIVLRSSRAFDTSPDLWLNLQKNSDLWYAFNHLDDRKRIQPIKQLDSLTRPVST